MNNGKTEKREEGIYIDLDELGYDKLSGRGQATHPLIIKVASISRSAAEKIKKTKRGNSHS